MEMAKKTLNASHGSGSLPGENGAHYSVELLEKARADTDTVLKELGSQLSGLSEAEADISLEAVRNERDRPAEASIGPDAPLS